jgi:alkylation response protein AidB-like acyl-CoA dehydrogenase
MPHTSTLDAESLRLVLDSLADFAKANLSDEKLLDFDEKDIFPEELVRAIGSEELGVQLVFIPEEHGGMGGGAFDVYRVCEAMARIDVGLATGVLATFLGSDPIVFGGTPEQREHWLSRIAEDGLLMAYGATEPAAGQRSRRSQYP